MFSIPGSPYLISVTFQSICKKYNCLKCSFFSGILFCHKHTVYNDCFVKNFIYHFVGEAFYFSFPYWFVIVSVSSGVATVVSGRISILYSTSFSFIRCHLLYLLPIIEFALAAKITISFRLYQLPAL